MNSTEAALNKFRDLILNSEKNGSKLWTYNPEYHHSMTFVPVDLKKLKDQELKENRESWRRFSHYYDWSYPGVKSAIESNQPPIKLDQASLDRLKEVLILSHLNLKEYII